MNDLHDRKFRSVLRDLSVIPIFAMIVTLVICVIACIYSFRNTQEQLAERNQASLRIAMNQLNNLEERIEQPFLEFVAQNENHAFLRRCTEDTPPEKTVRYESNVRKWLDEQVNTFREVQKAFVYYENMGKFQFRGTQGFDVQRYIIEQLSGEAGQLVPNQWQLLCIDKKCYVLYLFQTNHFSGGVWISADNLYTELGLDSEAYPGTVYIVDADGKNTYPEEKLNFSIASDPAASTFREGRTEYRNYVEMEPKEMLSIGFLSPQVTLFGRLPLASRLLFSGAFLAALLVMIVILWLRKQIVRPMRDVDEGMKLIAEGNLDYRLPTTDSRTYNEFDRLAMHFNAMMDELRETQFTLYETKLRAQKTKLRYISQQIRPHFILNALNIIYTYDESEFHLVKKMVMYLTRYFRYIVNLNRDFVEVCDELEHSRNYLKIQKERYPNRLDFLVECEVRAEKVLIPPLIIQTFLENSIKYGMKDEGQSFFFVNVTVKEETAEIFIADTGKGFDDETLLKINRFLENRQEVSGLGVGIRNVIERLDILYNGKAELKFWNEEDGGATILISIPARYASKEE